MHAICALHAVPLIQPLELALDLHHRFIVEKIAQLAVANELAQLRLIHGERLRAPLGQRRVAVVQEAGHIAEKQ